MNKNLLKNQFAIWRVDPPWLPRTKKAQGTKLGGGKGSIKEYVTPVKAKRIILEVGGHVTEFEVSLCLVVTTPTKPKALRLYPRSNVVKKALL